MKKIEKDGPIAPIPSFDSLQNSLSLPSEFEWFDLNVDCDKNMSDLYELLRNHYVEDADEMFRFDYQPEFIRWVLKPPGWNSTWHVGMRVVTTKKLVAFISAIPIQLRAYQKYSLYLFYI